MLICETSICVGKKKVFVFVNEKVFVQKIFAWFVAGRTWRLISVSTNEKVFVSIYEIKVFVLVKEKSICII